MLERDVLADMCGVGPRVCLLCYTVHLCYDLGNEIFSFGGPCARKRIDFGFRVRFFKKVFLARVEPLARDAGRLVRPRGSWCRRIPGDAGCGKPLYSYGSIWCRFDFRFRYFHHGCISSRSLPRTNVDTTSYTP